MKFQETLKPTYVNDDLWPLFLRFIKEKGISKRWILARRKEIETVPSGFLDSLLCGESLLCHNTIVIRDNMAVIDNLYNDAYIVKFDSDWRKVYHIYTALKRSKIYKIKRFIRNMKKRVLN